MPKGQPGVSHQRMIADILRDYPGARVIGFQQALRALRDEIGAEDDIPPSFRPDAYRINRDTRDIEIFEVEVSCVLSPAKIAQLGDWWFDWDSEGRHDWLPVLILVDRYGHRNHVDLHHAYHLTGPFARVTA